MKKTISIVLVVLMLLNTMGYYGVFLGLKYHNSLSVNQRLDDEKYLESQTITFKFPISIPYYPNTDYHRVSGEIEYQGNLYHLVKQKYFNDALYIVCYKDSKSQELNEALASYIENFGTTQSTTPKPANTVPTFIKDYVISQLLIQTSANGWNKSVGFGQFEPKLVSIPHSILSPPPEA